MLLGRRVRRNVPLLRCCQPTPFFQPTVTFDLQLALHNGFAQLINGLAGVRGTVKRARLSDVEGQHPLAVLLEELWVPTDIHFVLHPDHFGLGTNKDGRI